MDECNDVQALEKISSEVDESQIKVILSTQCIKAQAFLLDKLKKQSERHKETCNFISSTNLKVETEIKQAEHEIRSKLLAQETLKSANIEIKKELLLAKNRKADIADRVTDGTKKYEALWLESKIRYESIPFVQKLLNATEKRRSIELNIVDINKQIKFFYDDIERKRKICAQLDRDRSIELANFMVNEMPKAINVINEKTEMINNLTKEIEDLLRKQEPSLTNIAESLISKAIENANDNESAKDDDPNLSKNDDDHLMPKLNLVNFDLDIMDVTLDQVKIKKYELLSTIPIRTNNKIDNFEKHAEQRLDNEKAFEYISPYFKSYNDEKPRNFSVRKLINILEDVNINENEVYDIVKKVNPGQLRAVGEISADRIDNATVTQTVSKDKEDKAIVSETIEEIDLTSSNTDGIVIPPTQFLDIALSEDITTKRVSFDLPSSMQINEIEDEGKQDDNNEVNEPVNQTMNSQLEESAASDESFMKIKEMMLKKHNLDLSPQFVYAKNNVMQQRDDEKLVTSKFFQSRNEDDEVDEMNIDVETNAKEYAEIVKLEENGQEIESQKVTKEDTTIAMNLDTAVIASPKPNIVNLGIEGKRSEKPISGLLFTHGAQAIPDSLNVSMSTTGYEDSDFPPCIDSSLLLSPKADIPATSDDPEVLSQEVPNFLSGFRKSTFSFFGGPSTSADHKPDSSAENKGSNNFNFNFGGEKKNRGGLFSLFH